MTIHGLRGEKITKLYTCIFDGTGYVNHKEYTKVNGIFLLHMPTYQPEPPKFFKFLQSLFV